MTRAEAITAFLAHHDFSQAHLLPLAQDASFRRYWRITGGPHPAILMDAPPPEDIRAFVRIAEHLAALGLSSPKIHATDEKFGLLLEEDFGNALYATVLTPENTGELLDAAADALVVMHTAPPPPGLPRWDAEAMTQTALGTLMDWWWPAMFGTQAPDAARQDFFHALQKMLAPLARVEKFVHRDFIAGNLVWLPQRTGPRRAGLLDFQSAALGHPAYDLASLTQDARRDISPASAERAIARYLAARPELSGKEFRAAITICAAQRHLRVSGQWVRLARRDGKPHYLAHGPRSWALLNAALSTPETAPLAAAMDRWIPPANRKNPPPA